MKICICDDIQWQLDGMESLCRAFVTENGIEAEIRTVLHPSEIMTDPPDILILDIEMPEKSGIAVKDALAEEDRPLILFATGYEEYMPEAFGRNVIGFMRKPIEARQFAKMMTNAVNILRADRVITFEDGTAESSRRILMLETDAGYTTAILTDGTRKQWLRKSLKQWETELAETGFLRIDSGHLVNCRYIRRFSGSEILLENGETLQVSTRRRRSCFAAYMAYQKKTARFG